MKKLKKIIFVLLSILLLISLGIYLYLLSTKPKYEGDISIQNISKKTNVYFDNYGIPHIYADTEKDAMTVLGYVHAQDRLWQMELMRRIAPGRLAEIFGNKVSKTDLFFAGMGIEENSEKAISELDKNSQSYILANAYLDGINQYLEKGKTPIEFSILGIKKQKFTLKDVYNIFGFMSFSFAMAQKTDPLISDIQQNLGANYLKDFGLDGSFNEVQLKEFSGKPTNYSEISKQVASLLDNSPVQPFIGSNSWVLGPQKTQNGKVIFANDPHIGYGQPGTWYEAHIVCPDYETYGYYLAGTPFPLLAHNRSYAYGLTMFENDDADFFEEKINPENPNQYLYKNEAKDFIIKQKTIHVKDSADIVLNIKHSVHGPIMNDLIPTINSKNPIALRWIHTEGKNQLLEAVYRLSHAKNVEDFRNNIELIHSPGLNVMYGDAQGNISWTASGKLYQLEKNSNPNFILNGSNGIDDERKWLDFSKNPSSLNPPENYVYSANNQPEAIDNYLYPGYYLPKDRAKRIVSLVDSKPKWNKTDIEKMIVDNTSSTSSKIVKTILSQLETKNQSENYSEAFKILSNWSGSNNLNDIAPTIYNKFLWRYLNNTFLDELGKTRFDAFLNTHIFKQTIEHQLANQNSIWWDNIATKNKVETQKEIIQKSFNETVSDLEKQLGSNVSTWTWNRVHTLTFNHPLGKVKLLSYLFNVGNFEIAGSNEVINNQKFSYTDSGFYEVNAGPSTRRIIDFSDVENSLSVLPSGNSGNPMSKHYNDQAHLFVTGKFRKMMMNKAEIVKTSTKLVFKPSKSDKNQ